MKRQPQSPSAVPAATPRSSSPRKWLGRGADLLGRGPTLDQLLDGRNNNLGALRLFAALLVIFHHSFAIAGVPSPLPPFYANHYGLIGVAIFFVISGFLITQSYLRSMSPARFLLARVLRIFPALVAVTVLFVFVIGPLLTTVSTKAYFSNPWTLQYLRGALSMYEVNKYTVLPGVFMASPYPQINGSLWTLQYEWTFYIVVMILGLLGLLARKGFITTLFIGCLTVTFFNFAVDGNIYWTPLHWLPIWAMYFFFGSLAYVYRDRIRLTWGMVLVAVGMLVLSSFRGGMPDAAFVFFLGYIVLFVGFSRQVRLSWLTRSGDYSYGLYVWGWPVGQTVFWLSGRRFNGWLVLVVTAVGAFMLAVLSWHLLEKRMLRLKNTDFSVFRRKARRIPAPQKQQQGSSGHDHSGQRPTQRK